MLDSGWAASAFSGIRREQGHCSRPMALALVELFSYRRWNWLCKVVRILDYILMFTKYRDFPYAEFNNDFVL